MLVDNLSTRKDGETVKHCINSLQFVDQGCILTSHVNQKNLPAKKS